MPPLSPGGQFPRLTITTTGDQTLTLPDAFAGEFGVVLFYRGAWCPYCNAQLRAFGRGPSTGGPPSGRSTRPSAARSSTLPVPPG